MATKRNIFEEVAVKAEGPKGGMISGRKGSRPAVRIWLMLIFALVAVMILVGGLTRLTESGLSITEWKPITGVIPPLDDATWAAEFEKYKNSSQGTLVNAQITLEEFKGIFWWEWGHRQLGRTIGLVWAVGFAGLALARKIPPGWSRRFWVLGGLIGLQGLIGWLMVHSGLGEGKVTVSPLWLAAHLAGAFVIFGCITEWVLRLGRTEGEWLTARRAGEGKLYVKASGVMHLLALQLIVGALVAGVDAGQYYPTWPDMNGAFFPTDAFDVPALLWENPAVVQFAHRMLGYVLLAYGIFAWVKGRKSAYRATRRAFHAMAAMLLVQVALGIATVLSAAALHPAITHQLGAIILWVLVLRARHLAAAPRQGSIREGTA